MAKPTIFYLLEISKQIANMLPVISTIVGFFAWLYNFIELVLIGTMTWMMDKLNSVDTSAFSGVTLSTIEYIGYVNAVIPLSEMLGVLSAYYTAWITIILVRWAKSFVPTVAN